MRTDDFDFELPREFIAQHPATPRDSSRLLEVTADGLNDRVFRDLPDLLSPGDVMVFNDTRVLPTRLTGRRGEVTVEVTLHKSIGRRRWRAFARPAKRLKPGDWITFAPDFSAKVAEKRAEGEVVLVFASAPTAFRDALDQHGAMPLPPYIRRDEGPDPRDRDDYQTVYAAEDGAVAAPTAGLHFTDELLTRLDEAGIERRRVTLHVGAGTFLPVKTEFAEQHPIHTEAGRITAETAEAIELARRAGGRVVAVGTTSLRLLESAADENGRLRPFEGETGLFILPGYRFKVVDLLITNFHLPRSTLFMLVSAFSGVERMRGAYEHAKAAGYRFYSFGDACLLHRRAPEKAVGAAPGSATAVRSPARAAPGAAPAAAPSPRGGPFGLEVLAQDGVARRGRITTAHGSFETPAFMPVGTVGTVKGLLPEQVRATGAEIILGNTYHLMLRPGADRVARLGGLHRFINWRGPILTDSGGFQVMSLSQLREITDKGVTFQSHIDGSKHELTPERAVEIQDQLDADITMVLDECTPFPATAEEAARSMRRSLAWAERCRAAFRERPGYALFGIVQGSTFEDLRHESAEGLQAIGFDGYAVGGLAVGEGRQTMLGVLETTLPWLPGVKPRYLMGVGRPADIVEAVRRGIDMFDCVLPTRSGRTGQGFTRRGEINMKNARHQDDPRPIDPECPCPACRHYSRAYIHHLFRAGEMLGPILLTTHNLSYYQSIMEGLRQAIEREQLDSFVARFHQELAEGDLPEL